MEIIQYTTRRWIFFFLTAGLVIGGCSGIKRTPPPLAFLEDEPAHFRAGTIIHTESGKAIKFDTLISQLAEKELVFVGEVHDNPEHHLIQVQILQALTRGRRPVVAMEFFEKSRQAVLDSYVSGISSEKEFLKGVEWNDQWRFDYHLYRPLMLHIREKRGKILAINAPASLVRKVARSGIMSLKPHERDRIAEDIDLENKKHRDYIETVFKNHIHKDLGSFDFFYQAQCVWEDTMAESIAQYLTKNRERVIVLSGNGHIINKYGIPDRTSRRTDVTLATVLLKPLTGHVTLKKRESDYIWLTNDCSQRRFMTHPKKWTMPRAERSE
ncbi:MAG: ChaN family lipoprotein [Desulfatiglans sp.]|jgi:uncharacterized iron-regulated protein|nr:ChaN family lipoprotein [Desulfatiglans sp.]